MKVPVTPLERLVGVEREPIPCVVCPFWERRNGHYDVHLPGLRALLVKTALRHPLPVASTTLGMFVGLIVGIVIAR